MALIEMDFASSGRSEDWPDMTDATPLTIYDNRVTNVTKNGHKKIGTDVFIELAGTLATAPTSSSWRLADLSTIQLQSLNDYEVKIKIPIELQTKIAAIRPVGEENLQTITLYAFNTFSEGYTFEAKIIVHNQ